MQDVVLARTGDTVFVNDYFCTAVEDDGDRVKLDNGAWVQKTDCKIMFRDDKPFATPARIEE